VQNGQANGVNCKPNLFEVSTVIYLHTVYACFSFTKKIPVIASTDKPATKLDIVPIEAVTANGVSTDCIEAPKNI